MLEATITTSEAIRLALGMGIFADVLAVAVLVFVAVHVSRR